MLNKYATVVEDALLAQAQQTAETLQELEKANITLDASKKVIDAAAEDNAAYHVMLTNPDMLSAYVNDFFGPEGPYPVETAEDRLAAEVAMNEARFRPEAVAPQPQVQPQYERPQMDMPTPGTQAPAGDQNFWESFSQLSERNPAAAWQMLANAGPDALRSKVLVSEG